MIYYDAQNETITEGLAVLKAESETENASQFTIAYYEFIVAIAKGKGFDFLCDDQNAYWLSERDVTGVLKELLYAIETERITDSYTHRNIVEETLETLLDMYL